MEKMIKKMMVAGLACVALCGSAMAAPRHGNGPAPKGKAPMIQTTRHEIHKPAPVHHQVKSPAHRRHEVRPAHRMPPPRPVAPCHRHHRHDCHDCHYDDNGWIELGAGIIGGIIGALIAG